ncbi:XP_029653084.1uncharacterized protein LOC115226206 [Octopus vulgaris]|uniref:XP_029653084.1uncharacterized protein LOC115226206 n=1 Tax=Octopus vulgaris TaxID=6645 RepID=A0AA36C248_OCTVU|nr:XP_029653084.1uncharacterized protein LOC115226206 [Octopus vulgaris]
MDPEIVISYDIKDFPFVERLAAELKPYDWKVWYDKLPSSIYSTVEYSTSQRGQAVVKSKIFLMVLSLDSIENVTCQNELALAYVTNSIIIPVARIDNFKELGDHLNSGMKLMLSKLNWCFFGKSDNFDKKFKILIGSIKADMYKIAPMRCFTKSSSNSPNSSKFATLFRQNSVIKESTVMKTYKDDTDSDDSDCHSDLEVDSNFWDRHFPSETSISWDIFKQCFLVDYEEQISSKYSYSKLAFFINMIFRDIFHCEQKLDREVFNQFCQNENGDSESFYNKLQQYAVGYHAMKQVFNMDSQHRLTAIENLGSYSSPAVLHFLEDMLHESDPNIRAVATIALAKAGKGSKRETAEKILPMLQDKDRIVRESAVLSLGKLKDRSCVKAIIDRWRNDPVNGVRQVAQEALAQIGGEEADRCVAITKLLMSEIEALKTKS